MEWLTNMSKIFIFDAATGEEVLRDMTAEELAEAETGKAISEANAEAHKNAKNALLEKLGITAEEAALLLS
jgi:hypothetical protein